MGGGKDWIRFQPVAGVFQTIQSFSLDATRLAAMNLTDFRDNALLKLQVGGPFAGGMVDITDQEYILIQVEQTEQPGQRRRRGQQVGVSAGAPGKEGQRRGS